ncbi:hypothetical protein SORBI_3002G221300 [Sorghum bicolor]|uniref:F-box domain-containing protein n=1 Tax=Sorghum bicolor TaxID=4558 RepID=A0A1W0W5E0_SORBI|nr:hypothetical protein SORBI_3002G221300 [Sorghum bicolor]
MRTVACIPDDVIFNILSQLPTKSVIRCKSVCKAWLTIISSEHFIRAHLDFSRVRSTTLVVSRRYMGWQHEGMDSTCMGFYRYIGGSKVEIVHSQDIPKGIGLWATPSHCDGLILVSTEKQVTVVCNPATREFVKLPKGSDSISSIHKSRAGFGFDPCSNKYKAARFFYETGNEKSETVCRFEVHTLGTSTWRRTADPPYPIFWTPPAHVQGYLYWRIDLPPSKHPKAFVKFSLSEEMFSLTPYPPSKEAKKPVYFIELEGKLCCACFTKRFEAVEIWTWTLDNDKSPKWTQYCTNSAEEHHYPASRI